MLDDEAAAEEAIARRVWARYVESELAGASKWVPVAGGFSAAQLWRIEVPGRCYCLRRWPRESPDESRLKFIHDVLRHVTDQGIAEVAVPIPSLTDQTFVSANRSLWELQPWMPGIANYEHSPSPIKLAAAMRFLARFHIAAGSYAPARYQHPPGIVARNEQLQGLVRDGLDQLQLALRRSLWPELFTIAERLLHDLPRFIPGVQTALQDASRLIVPVQICLRDIWHDHVLFDGDQVTGVIDFGALNDDHVACDVSRLLGSLVRNDLAGWRAELAAYESIRTLTIVDRQLVSTYDRSGVLLGITNWLKWLYVDRRQFPDVKSVQKRLAYLSSRLLAIPK